MSFTRQLFLVTRREVASLLCMPLYYVLCGVFFMLAALVYLQQLVVFSQGGQGTSVNATDSVVVPTFQMLHFFLLIQVPLLTMRVFAEDRSNGMLDLLQTMPARDWAVLGGKFLATFLGIAIYTTITPIFPVVTGMMTIVDWPVVIGSVIALLLSSAGYVSIGLLFSAASESQVAAAVLSYVTLFMLAFGQAFASASNVQALDDAARHFTVTEHINGLISGNIAPMNVAYFVVMAWVGLFVTARLLEARRWRST
ncbi:ABC transporter permease subunit [bacterium]|nr:ABC transporter permease subunit [bacterium]